MSNFKVVITSMEVNSIGKVKQWDTKTGGSLLEGVYVLGQFWLTNSFSFFLCHFKPWSMYWILDVSVLSWGCIILHGTYTCAITCVWESTYTCVITCVYVNVCWFPHTCNYTHVCSMKADATYRTRLIHPVSSTYFRVWNDTKRN